MQFVLTKIKNYPVSVMYIIIIWVLCFMDVPETPLDNVRFIDKWTHIVMYLGTCLTIWMEYRRNHCVRLPGSRFRIVGGRAVRPKWLRLVLWAWLAPMLMSGLIEILQATCTGGRRSGDWMDFCANAVGCTLALLVMLFIPFLISRWHEIREDRCLP